MFRLITLASAACVIAFGYLLWRSSTPLVWNDSPTISVNLFETEGLHWKSIGALPEIARLGFSDLGGGAYRPLSRAIALLGTALFSNPDIPTTPWYLAIGLLFGVTATGFFLVARRFLQSNATAVLAVFLFLLTPSVVGGAWVVFSGIQVIVYLLICLGLLLYWWSFDAARARIWYRVGLYTIMLLGPWFREVIGVLSLLVIFLEAQRARRPTVTMGISALALFHAVYPTALIAWVVYPDLPLKPVFAMGHVQSRLAADFMWAMPLHFLTLYPPLLMLAGLGALLLPLVRRRQPASGTEADAAAGVVWFHGRLDFARIAGIGFALVMPIWLLAGGASGLALWLCFGFVVVGGRRDGFLAWWFVLTFVPFLRLFTEHVHLAYAAMPTSIILITGLEDVWRALQTDSAPTRLAKYAVGMVLLVASGDHALNVYGSHRVVHAVNHGIVRVADWLRANVPEGSIIVTNVIHGEDIRLFSEGHVKAYYTVTAGIARDCAAVADPLALAELIRQNRGQRTIYFLDVDFDYPAEKETYHSHKYVRARSVEMEDLGVAHVTRVRYPYLDPLKAFVPRAYIAFLGAPDLENDFYRGPSLNRTPFVREVHAEYGVYRLTGSAVSSWEPKGRVVLVAEGYQGFNVLSWNGRYFAVPQGEGPFDLRRINRHGYSRHFVADTYDALLAQIKTARELKAPTEEVPSARAKLALAHRGYRGFRLVRYDGTVHAISHGANADPRQLGAPGTSVSLAGESVAAVQILIDRWWDVMRSALPRGQTTQMVREGYRGFDILAVNDRYVAVPRGEGSFDPRRLRKRQYSRSFSASTYDEIVALIESDEAARLGARYHEGPVLLREGYRGFNLVGYARKVYAMPQPEGALDLERLRRGEYSAAIVADTEDRAVRRVDRRVAMAQAASARRIPVLLKQGYRGFNLVEYDGKVYGLPQRDGPFDFARVRRKGYQPLFVGCSTGVVVRLIDQSLKETE